MTETTQRIVEFIKGEMTEDKGFFYGSWWKDYEFELFHTPLLENYFVTISKTWTGFSLKFRGLSTYYRPRIFYLDTIEKCIQQIQKVQDSYHLVLLRDFIERNDHQGFYHLLTWEEKLVEEEREKRVVERLQAQRKEYRAIMSLKKEKESFL